MDPMLEDLARARMTARVDEAEGLRRGRQHVKARRFGGKAEAAARRANLALARIL